MACEGCLDGDLGGFPVTDLTDEGDVGVGTQNRAKRRGEGQPGFAVDLDLGDAGEPVLDRILGGDDVDFGPVQHVEGGVERGRLSRTRGTGDENRPVRLGVGRLVSREVVLAEAEVGELQKDRALVEDPEHHLLAVHGRKGCHVSDQI